VYNKENKVNKMNFKSKWADVKLFVLNKWHLYSSWTKLFLKDLTHDLKIDENGDLRLFVFVFVYLVFSVVGAYNFAHLAAFLYIVWLLEKQHGN
jgi:hypothetical protein